MKKTIIMCAASSAAGAFVAGAIARRAHAAAYREKAMEHRRTADMLDKMSKKYHELRCDYQALSDAVQDGMYGEFEPDDFIFEEDLDDE